ncbi:NYN domain-containing protein [Trinickia dinghuensis]|uniref:NYN domain-containing protein n=1 Tax=Trinickia dinghuensis TaxID=2291023 RepID=A0A3D8K3D3_9BURK|nr:NYN domain-containing protein [Trinickia dinghuensis]RDU99739.1 NYN domain-containing protein [Trinickia dinghuensis]
MSKVAVFIDGGHLRSYARKAKKTYNPAFVVATARATLSAGDTLFRILYYDCDPFSGTVKKPVSNTPHTFPPNQSFLNSLAEEELVAVRRGVLKFRGWERTKASLAATDAAVAAGNPPPAVTDADFSARFEQKGVDLRIGLDLSTMADSGAVEEMIVMTGDTDLIPALKLVRARGFQVSGVALPNYAIIGELRQHLDLFRSVAAW